MGSDCVPPRALVQAAAMLGCPATAEFSARSRPRTAAVKAESLPSKTAPAPISGRGLLNPGIAVHLRVAARVWSTGRAARSPGGTRPTPASGNRGFHRAGQVWPRWVRGTDGVTIERNDRRRDRR